MVVSSARTSPRLHNSIKPERHRFICHPPDTSEFILVLAQRHDEDQADRCRRRESRRAFSRSSRTAADCPGETVSNYGRLFHRAAAHVSLLVEEAARAGKRWFQAHDHCQQAFA
jgi:hypothetical protein